MSETPNDFRRALSELVERTYPEASEHPSAERWLAYQRGELAAGEEVRLEEHLVRCRDCFDLAQAAADFAAGEAGGGEEEGSAATRGLWRLVRQGLGENPATSREAPAARPPRRARWRAPYPLAAALAVALLGSAAWNVVEQREIAALRAPRPDVQTVDLAFGERSAPAETTVAADRPAVLVLHPRVVLPAYRLAIRDAASGRLVGSYALEPDADQALTLALPAGGLSPGRYKLQLTGEREESSLRVTEAGRGG